MRHPLRRTRPAAPRPVAYWPALEGRQLAVFGNIHGRDDLLAAALARLDARAVPGAARPTEIYLGDLIDYGPDSRGVIARLLARAQSREVIALRGDHEALLLRALSDDAALRAWLARRGGEATLRSYRCPIAAGTGWEAATRALLRAALPPAHLAFLRRMPVSFSLGALYFVHAGIRPGRLIADPDEGDLLTITEPFLSSRRNHGLLVVHAHSPVPEPEFRLNRINLDTGAVVTGRLTGLLISDRAIEFV
ncbi:metallophosphoesterase [Methylobacterium sp. WSM2598]|uniref:metallophosphoesterase n=1 Tax=Methylobacterium sp. WSM2598 TaxID=398261 RepID=UPI000683D823|nr:metallophosphoesterase [Methylobacterium sp. WSM2598]